MHLELSRPIHFVTCRYRNATDYRQHFEICNARSNRQHCHSAPPPHPFPFFVSLMIGGGECWLASTAFGAFGASEHWKV
jgi:hypothetical protein